MPERFEPSPDDLALAPLLSALSNPVRLALLRYLRTPRILSEVRIASEAGEDAVSAISRQSVRKHLDQLVQAGVVVPQPAERGFGETTEYVVNHQRIFAITEELRELAQLRPVQEPRADDTMEASGWISKGDVYPRLVLVRGVGEGRTFALRPLPGTGESAWIVGRAPGAWVRLDYDPFASLENARIRLAGGAYRIEDLGSRNGTSVNFARLAEGRPAPLAHGDLVGVGHSILAFQARPGGGQGA